MGGTHVRVASLGYGTDERSLAMRQFFEAGNQQTIHPDCLIGSVRNASMLSPWLAAITRARLRTMSSSLPESAMDATLKAIIEFREEMREFRAESRGTLKQHSHRLNVIDANVASLKADVAVLLGSTPALNERLTI